MTLSNFIKNFDEEGSIILLEGKRNVHPKDEHKLSELGNMLCKKLQFAKFRSGNASGADYFFCKGVSDIDSKRLELVLPYSSHRKNYLLTDNLHSVDEMDLLQEPEVVYQTKSNKQNKKLIDLYISGNRGKTGIKGSYLTWLNWIKKSNKIK